MTGLPSAVTFDVDPAATGHATFTMGSPIDSVNFLLTGGEGILGTAIKQVDLDITHIPANWTADWDPTGGNVTAVGDHVNLISLIVSKELPGQNDAMRAPFTSPGGAISYQPWLRAIDRRWRGPAPATRTFASRTSCRGSTTSTARPRAWVPVTTGCSTGPRAGASSTSRFGSRTSRVRRSTRRRRP